MPSPARVHQSMSVILAFDCSVAGLSVAIVRDDVPLARSIETGRDQSSSLLPTIERLMREASIDRRDIALIAVTVGPGSFTGVRMGLAAAHGLAIGLGVPLAGLATTAVLLAQAPTTARVTVAAIDSRLGDWFCAIADEPQPFLAPARDLAVRLQGRRCLVVGAGAVILAAELAKVGLDVVGHEALPDPVVLARLAAATGSSGWHGRNEKEGLPRPLYLRGVNITLADGARRTVE
jgi:tRNA threonylcarbamoyladenosine biosynthesis protein TsaB